jgi:hypothetical protein
MSCKTKNCGCTDVGLTTPAPCPCEAAQCANPDVCPETFSDNCVIHTGDTIVDLGILQGDALTSILQKMVIKMTQPLCVPGTSCASAINFKSTAIGSTTASFVWDPVPSTGTTQYILQYRKPSAAVWTSNPIVTTAKDSLSGLEADTQYYVRVNTKCGGVSTCYSVTLLITTKP